MNNRLAEFASIQVEAIDGVLAMVARDRLRVEALLEDAESPSLRQYLRAWLDATPVPAAQDIEASEEEEETLGSLETIEQEPAEVCCCDRDCWKDLSLSFWDTFQHRPECLKGRFGHATWSHQHQRSRLAFGVSYEWATQPDLEGFEWNWESKDQYFRGRTCRGQDPDLEAFYFRQHAAGGDFPGAIYRVGLIQEEDERNVGDMKALFGEDYNETPSCLPTVHQVTMAGGEITYDIIIYASDLSFATDYGEIIPALCHHRTAKGTLVLSVVGNVLKGTVQLDPSMRLLDAVPFGGDLSWTETGRMERTQSTQSTRDRVWDHSSTSVLCVSGRVDQHTTAEEAKGELKVVGQRTPVFLDHIIEFFHPQHRQDRVSQIMLDLADQKMGDYNRKRCLWMHRHTSLPQEVVLRIGAFVSPPPILYLEPGDLVLDMDWGTTLEGLLPPGVLNEEEGIMSLSSIIARPRKGT